MKLIFRIFVVVIVIVTMIFVGANIFVRRNGRQIVIARLSAALHRHVDIGDLRVIYPLGLGIRQLDIEGYGHIKEVSVGLGVFYLWDNNLSFSSLALTEPQIVIQRTKDSAVIPVESPKEESSAKPKEEASLNADPNAPPKVEPTTDKKRDAIKFSINKLVVKNGAVRFADNSSEGDVTEITVNHINLRAKKVSFSEKPMRTKFELTANIVGPGVKTSDGKIESHGWFNFAKRDMKGEIKIADLDGRIFSPFFGTSGKKKSTHMVGDLSADLESRNNDMTVKGKIQIKEFSFKKEKGEESKPFSTQDFIIGSLQSLAKGIAIDFSFKTKMDNFKIESLSFSGSIFSKMFGDKNEKFRLAGVLR